jgi:hypothetical protein
MLSANGQITKKQVKHRKKDLVNAMKRGPTPSALVAVAELIGWGDLMCSSRAVLFAVSFCSFYPA